MLAALVFSVLVNATVRPSTSFLCSSPLVQSVFQFLHYMHDHRLCVLLLPRTSLFVVWLSPAVHLIASKDSSRTGSVMCGMGL